MNGTLTSSTNGHLKPSPQDISKMYLNKKTVIIFKIFWLHFLPGVGNYEYGLSNLLSLRKKELLNGPNCCENY